MRRDASREGKSWSSRHRDARGELTLEALGEGVRQEMLSRAYPRLENALSDAYGDGDHDSYETLLPIRRETIAKAVEAERNRLAGDHPHTTEPQTELGRDVKKQTDVPTVLVDRIVRDVATTKLKHFQGRGKPS